MGIQQQAVRKPTPNFTGRSHEEAIASLCLVAAGGDIEWVSAIAQAAEQLVLDRNAAILFATAA